MELMGILNVTPDSFSDGGRWNTTQAAVHKAEEMLAQGASVIDVGGESTRPGATHVDEAEELRRALPVVAALAGSCRISIDTMKPAVARAAVDAGATIINDVSGELGQVAAETGSGWVCMHMLGRPADMQADPRYTDACGEVARYLDERATKARLAGVTDIWVDPGIGFGKAIEHNLALLRDLRGLVAEGTPVLLGASRKSMIDAVDRPGDPSARLGGSIAIALAARDAGVAMLRIHDVAETRQALAVADAIAGRGPN